MLLRRPLRALPHHHGQSAVSLFNLEAEQALLGAALFDNATVARVVIPASDFYDPVHADLWTEIAQAYRGGRLVDANTLREWAAKRCPEIGGAIYLLKLLEAAAPLSAQARSYAELIHDLAMRRETVAAAKAAIAEAEGGAVDAPTVRGALEQRLQEIAQNDADADAWHTLSSVTASSAERAELGEARGISTGFERLDRVTGGLQPGTLWVIGGATSMGKSVFGAALSRNLAAGGVGVGEIHLEMDATQIGLRTSTALTFDPDHRRVFDNPTYLAALRGEMSEEQWRRLREGAADSHRLPIYIDARPGRSLSQIEAAARRLFQKMRREGVTPGALIIDHEGLIAPEKGDRFGSMLERASARGEALLAIGKRLGAGVVALAQLTNEGARADGSSDLPSVTQIKYGGALTQAASVVILLHRKAYHAERKPKHLRDDRDWSDLKSRETTLIVDKSRAGMREHITVLMDMPSAAVWEPAA